MGFDECRITVPSAIPQAPERLATALEAGHLGEMNWMADTAERRADPCVLWPDARSVVVLAINYGPRSNPLDVLEHPSDAGISVYARHRDYHDVIKGRLKTLAQKLLSWAGSGDVKVFVDTAPLMEKPLAEAAGVGWQGKHTNLVSREHGSWLFLGSILTTLDLPRDDKEDDHCGTCRRCLDACPTDAFPAPYQLDARRCISYLTIENKDPIPHEFRRAMGNRVYGCDDCLAICPWNKFAHEASEAKLAEPADWRDPPLADMLVLDDASFRSRFAGSPVKRIGRERFLRNCLIAAGNSGDAALIPYVQALLHDPSPLLRGAAVWALSCLLGTEAFGTLRARQAMRESDDTVRNEWNAA